MSAAGYRRIRSFVRRPGRITASQQRALESLWPRFGIEFGEQRISLEQIFGRRGCCVLDIGFGDGEALVTMAARSPEVNFLGVEVHEPGIGHLLVLLERARLTNVRIIRRDVVDVIDHMLEAASFDVVNIFFPDPWPKKRHHKRRLISESFLPRLSAVMKPGGMLHISTDWQHYAQWITDVMARAPAFEAREHPPEWVGPLAQRPPTKFEHRGIRLGHSVTEFIYVRAEAS
jgi:tRNA (guanine-N7-)-methyltransferase